jgi:hypothetical protein
VLATQGMSATVQTHRRLRWQQQAAWMLLVAMPFNSALWIAAPPTFAQDKGAKPADKAGDKSADKPGDKPADKPQEDRQKWSPDKKADEAIKHAKDKKAKAEKIIKDPCPKNKDEWEKWSKETLEVAACLIAIREAKRPLRKTGPGADKLKEFDQALGDKEAQEKMNSDLFEKAKKCAEAAGVDVDGPGIYQKILKRAEEKKKEELGYFGLGPMVVRDCCEDDNAAKQEESRPEEEMEEHEREMGR